MMKDYVVYIVMAVALYDFFVENKMGKRVPV